ncbi:hypothetical protein FB451DRAFT_1190365 [Mycena latifolia]|nr:hypothetical protein FB451DRAFT_1190365 [Mycena latifolia]
MHMSLSSEVTSAGQEQQHGAATWADAHYHGIVAVAESSAPKHMLDAAGYPPTPGAAVARSAESSSSRRCSSAAWPVTAGARGTWADGRRRMIGYGALQVPHPEIAWQRDVQSEEGTVLTAEVADDGGDTRIKGPGAS